MAGKESATWDMIRFAANGTIFVLLDEQLPGVPRTIVSSSRGPAVVVQSGSPGGHALRPACEGIRQSW